MTTTTSNAALNADAGDPVIDRIVRTYASLGPLVAAVLARWPAHEPYLRRSLGAHDPEALLVLDSASAQVMRLIGDEIETFCDHYQWMCDVFNKETLHFVRTGEYRCKTFAEANERVYSNKEFMEKYMNGLLVSQALWFNHARSLLGYTRRFMPSLARGADYLEIGPGHGLFLAQAANDPKIKSVTAWDVSAESLRQTGEALLRLGVTRPVELLERDVTAETGTGEFDAIVISEVLEHLEKPLAALTAVARHLRADGLMFINVPINSPAPDHIYLLRTPEEAAALVRSAGLEIIEESAEPMSGYTIADAMALKGTVTCLFMVKRKH